MLGRDRRGAHDDLGAVRLEHVALVLAHLVGAHEDAAVALLLRHHGQADPGVARRRLDDRAARLQLAGGFGRLDHPGRDPVLHRAARVEVLDLREHHRPLQAVERALEPEQGRVADQVHEGVDVLHPVNLLPRSGHGGIDGVRRVIPWGRLLRRASWPPPPPMAGVACPCWAGASTACSPPRPSWRGRRSGNRAASRRRTRPAGTAGAVPVRPSRSRCSATPEPPATAWTGSWTPPALDLATGLAGPPAGASTCGRTPGWARSPPTWPARSTGACRSGPTSP